MPAKNDTGQMMEVAVSGGAVEVLGAILEHQAAERDWLFDAILADKDREIERLRFDLRKAYDFIDLMQRRIAWLGGGPDPNLPEED